MILRDDFSAFCNAFLRVSEVPDSWCVNGLQVPGKENIEKVALGVSASRNFLQQAADWGADAVFTHHGLFWKSGVKTISPLLAERLRILMSHKISLFSFHLPLDAHPEVGNNVTIAHALGAKTVRMEDICAIAEFSYSLSFSDFEGQCQKVFGRSAVFSESFEKEEIKTIGICSGGGADYAEKCFSAGVDVFLTGEISEHHYHDFAEFPLPFLVFGHYTTETFGVRAMLPMLQQQFPSVIFSFFPESCPV
ncbi:Nif3-like dinuclear metal center hexameric protein [Candidatus Peregrinibacteria bacterium]|nr:MAG: Nif3-like dinuclear metal center hexameric protein [Candidatus Peregrinibacteria bacterium]